MARGGGAYAASTAGKGAPGAYNARRGAGSLPSAPFPRPCGRAGGGLGRNGTGRDGLNWTGLEVAVGSGSAVCRKFRPEWESCAGSVQIPGNLRSRLWRTKNVILPRGAGISYEGD